MLWIGRIITALPVLFLIFDIIIHLMNIAPVQEAFAQLGWPGHLAVPIGIIELISLVLYLIPRTSVLGAILLTGYLGGAVATNLRVENPIFTHVLFPVYIGILLWLGLFFLDSRVRDLIPLRKDRE